jgi:hypothetical protein
MYGLQKVGITTIARWMHAAGFRYKKRGKHYFVDGHERPETLAYRPASKAPVLRENNNNVNFSIDVLYFVPENLKKVQESC